jgi:hypothetical protein
MSYLFVLRLLVREVLPCATSHWSVWVYYYTLCNHATLAVRGKYVRRKLSKLVSDHVFCYGDILVILPIVYLELETHKVRKDSR